MLMFTCFSLYGGHNVYAASNKTMYVTASILNVRASTTTNSKILTQIKRNTAVTLIQKKGSWVKIKVNGKLGWVSILCITTKSPSLKIVKTKTESMNYKTINQNDSSLEKGKTKVIRSGKKGIKITTYEEKYKNGKLISTRVISTKVISRAIDQIIKVGTKVIGSPNKIPVSPVVVNKTSNQTISNFFNISASIQSITYLDNYFYIATCTPDNYTVIYKYDSLGHNLGQTEVLPIVHGASVSANASNGHLFVTNGGGMTPTKIYEVDFNTQQILSVIDLSGLGNSGLSVIDQETSNLWVETAPNDDGTHTFSYCDLKGNVLKQFTLPNQGVPQGIDYKNGLIYLYTNNKITVISTTGQILRSLNVNLPGESEGMVILPDGTIVVGFSVWQSKIQEHEGEFSTIKGFE